MRIWVMILDDRHTDIEVEVYTRRQTAINAANKQADDMLKRYGYEADKNDEDITKKLNEEMIKANWVYYCCYSCEGDSIHVVEKQTQDE